MIRLLLCGVGEIGIRSGLKIRRLTSCGFKSRTPHHISPASPSSPFYPFTQHSLIARRPQTTLTRWPLSAQQVAVHIAQYSYREKYPNVDS